MELRNDRVGLRLWTLLAVVAIAGAIGTAVAVPGFGVTLTPGFQSKSGHVGDVLQFKLKTQNTGVAPDQYAASVTGAPGSWGVSVQPASFLLMPGESANLTLTVSIGNASGNSTNSSFDLHVSVLGLGQASAQATARVIVG